MDSVQTIKKDGFLRLIVFTIVKITSTDKEMNKGSYKTDKSKRRTVGFCGKVLTDEKSPPLF
jgi:hypothetical protein